MATAPSAARHNVNFITGNANKLIEVKAILEPAIQVDSQVLDLIEVQGTLEEVTLDKCRRAADIVSSNPVLEENQTCCRVPRAWLTNFFALSKDPRPRASRGHVPVLQLAQRLAWTVHVS
jgi:hypothetical protein